MSKPVATGAQIVAARALLDWTQDELAEAAKVHPNTVAYWERCGRIHTGPGAPVAFTRMRQELLAAGVEITTEPERGVRLVEARGK